MTTTEVRTAYEAVLKAKAQLLAALKSTGPELVEDWILTRTDGQTVQLSELFEDHDDLLIIHNMGKGCSYCTLWADGFRGYIEHIERRCAFVLCSNDGPDDTAKYAKERGWNFPCVSGANSGFTAAMGYANQDGRTFPGVSSFHKNNDGSIVRIAHSPFGPGDDFCAVWPLFDLLQDGKGSFAPR